MEDWINAGLIIFIWFVNLFLGTNLDKVFHITEIAQTTVCCFALILFFLNVFSNFIRFMLPSGITYAPK